MNQDATPGSHIFPPEALADPVGFVARHCELEREDIRVVSTETVEDGQIKIRFFILP